MGCFNFRDRMPQGCRYGPEHCKFVHKDPSENTEEDIEWLRKRKERRGSDGAELLRMMRGSAQTQGQSSGSGSSEVRTAEASAPLVDASDEPPELTSASSDEGGHAGSRPGPSGPRAAA